MWQELLKTALLGTERSQLPAEILTQLQEYGIDSNSNPTQIVLECSAMLGQMRKAGMVLQTYADALPDKAIVSEENFCNRLSIHHLGLILEGSYRKCLPEFTYLANKMNKILPPEYLPTIFKSSLRDLQLWQTVIPIIGNHGRWLLQQKAWQRLRQRLQETNVAPFSEKEIYPVLKNKFQIWGEEDVVFRSHPQDFGELRAFWQSLETRVYDNFIQKSLQILLFREEIIKALSTPETIEP